MKHFAILEYKNSSIVIEKLNFVSDYSFMVNDYNLDFKSDFTDVINKGYIDCFILIEGKTKKARFKLSHVKCSYINTDKIITKTSIETYMCGYIAKDNLS